MDRSKVSMIAKEFLLKKSSDRLVVVVKINRICNYVAHDLCQMARTDVCVGVLQSLVPTCALSSTLSDCNPNDDV
jgi:hypothetical protein